MDCKKAQRLYDDLADGRVSEPVAVELRRHLAACTDCRVIRQRAMRLQQLLALKRHEQPVPAYFDRFLPEFHRRLAVEAMRPNWRQRLQEAFRLEVAPVWRYGFAGACGAMLAVGFFWKMSVPSAVNAVPPAPAIVTSVKRTAPVTVAWHSEASRPQYVLDRIAVTPVSYETANIRF
jgi:predicted anti-sigma-YlaC factor YlaD